MVERSAIRILVLDDESFMLKLLNRVLVNAGFTDVTLFDSGQAALDRIMGMQGGGPDVILLDLNMPVMDGIEFVRHLVGLKYQGSLILVSGEDERMLRTAEKLVQAHHIPILGYLHKPVKPDALAALVEQWAPASSVEGGAAKKAL